MSIENNIHHRPLRPPPRRLPFPATGHWTRAVADHPGIESLEPHPQVHIDRHRPPPYSACQHFGWIAIETQRRMNEVVDAAGCLSCLSLEMTQRRYHVTVFTLKGSFQSDYPRQSISYSSASILKSPTRSCNHFASCVTMISRYRQVLQINAKPSGPRWRTTTTENSGQERRRAPRQIIAIHYEMAEFVEFEVTRRGI